MEMEVPLQVMLSLCLTGVCSLVVYLYYITWLRPEGIRSKLRQQGIAGPPSLFLYGSSLEMKKLLMAERTREGRGGEVKHGFTQHVFPHFEQWRKEYGTDSMLPLLSLFFFFLHITLFLSGPVFVYSLGNAVVLHVSHPDWVKEISLCSSLDLGKSSYLKKSHEPLFGQGILKSSGRSWSHQRKILAPEFFSDKVKVRKDHFLPPKLSHEMVSACHPTKVQGMVELMVDSAWPLLKSWEEKVELRGGTAAINVDEDLRRYSADVISRTCFGSNYSRGKEIFVKIRELQKAVSRPNLFAETTGLR
ncbi:hypothetical protein BHE74_00030675 [Ensete ventricosum]|nr:hypothetical protein BHE74_00030675 [Ensete ventricosum]